MDRATMAETLLWQHWGHKEFKPLQREIINSLLAGKDTVALLPTGGGKSVCYQLPALMSDGICLVISPLIALMQDQTQRLKTMGIAAEAIHSGLSFGRTKGIIEAALNGQYKILYLSPERLQNDHFKATIEDLDISIVAVDEAHCVSQWGHDFRPSYLNIAEIRKVASKATMIAVTATATTPVLEDIITHLQLRNAEIYRGSFRKPNLYYRVKQSNDRALDVIEAIRRVKGSGLIYCRSRKQTEFVVKSLHHAGISATAYHAGMGKDRREAAQQAWMSGKAQIMAATTAFGMGIDKGDVRLVVHYDLPEHLEAYYQEVGRAGRDSNNADALCLYNAAALKTLQASVALRFPDDAYLRKVYQAVCEYLQIPIGAEPNQYYSFAIEEMSRRFDLKPAEALHAMRLLSQEGLWTMTETVNSSPIAQITTNREIIDDLIERYPQHGSIALAMLRLYGSILQSPTSIKLASLAKQCRISIEQTELILQQLRQMDVVEYEEAKEGPQLYFHHYRVDSSHLHINNERIRVLRARYAAQVAAMTSYLESDACREKNILIYFDEEAVEDCGHCDRCIAKKERYADNRENLMRIIADKPGMSLKVLLQLLPQSSTTDNLRSLVDEGSIRRDDAGGFWIA